MFTASFQVAHSASDANVTIVGGVGRSFGLRSFRTGDAKGVTTATIDRHESLSVRI